MNDTATGRMRKLTIRDNSGYELSIETDDQKTLEFIEQRYREDSGKETDDLIFMDMGNRHKLGDKRQRIGNIWPELGDIEIKALPDTFNAHDRA